MSFSFKVSVVVGVKVPQDSLYIKTTISTHEKCKNKGTGKFCSTCGTALDAVYTTREPISGYNEGDAFYGLDMYYLGDTVLLCVARINKIGDDEPIAAQRIFIDPTLLEQHRKTMRDVLEPRGLWDEQQFGVWLYMWCG